MNSALEQARPPRVSSRRQRGLNQRLNDSLKRSTLSSAFSIQQKTWGWRTPPLCLPEAKQGPHRRTKRSWMKGSKGRGLYLLLALQSPVPWQDSSCAGRKGCWVELIKGWGGLGVQRWLQSAVPGLGEVLQGCQVKSCPEETSRLFTLFWGFLLRSSAKGGTWRMEALQEAGAAAGSSLVLFLSAI